MESQHTLLINSNKGCQEQAWRSISHPMSHRTHREHSRFQRGEHQPLLKAVASSAAQPRTHPRGADVFCTRGTGTCLRSWFQPSLASSDSSCSISKGCFPRVSSPPFQYTITIHHYDDGVERVAEIHAGMRDVVNHWKGDKHQNKRKNNLTFSFLPRVAKTHYQ